MWFFMITCYVMSVMTFVLLGIAFLQSFLKFHVWQADHVTFMILTSIVYSFTETLVIFFFVGTGVSVKEYTLEHHLDSGYHKRSIGVKREVYPPLMMNILYMIILFVLVGAVDTQRVPAWIYYGLFVFCIGDYVRVKVIQNNCFRKNTQIILDMSGIEKKVA
ncbi:MAG: hypothetical protein KC897_03235 [Candidatus Omnitrophica bacterium]|nr:hypothetical protein [Candidatus Omnitrophota bacterium]